MSLIYKVLHIWKKEIRALRKVEAIVRSDKLNVLHKELLKAGIQKMTAVEVRYFGSHKEHTEIYRSEAYSIDSLARVKVEIIVPQNKVSTVVSILTDKAQTGRGEGDKIFVSSVNDISRTYLKENEESVWRLKSINKCLLKNLYKERSLVKNSVTITMLFMSTSFSTGIRAAQAVVSCNQ